MVACLKVTGITIVRMGRVNLSQRMGQSLLENLIWTFNKGMGRKHGQGNLCMKATSRKARNMGKGNCKCWENLVMRVTLTKTLYTGRECTVWKVGGNMKVNGKGTRCMDRGSSPFRMVGIIREITYVIRKMDMESFTGLTDDHIKEIGCKGNNKAKEYTRQCKGCKSTTFGTRADACEQTPINCKSQNDGPLYFNQVYI